MLDLDVQTAYHILYNIKDNCSILLGEKMIIEGIKWNKERKKYDS